MADSGGATISALPESSNVQAHVEIDHNCYIERFCDWYGEASAYLSSIECPSVFDESHGVWIQNESIRTQSETVSEEFSFDPSFAWEGYATNPAIKLCLYANAETSSLVGESHPFNLYTKREILPKPHSPPHPKTVTITLTNNTVSRWIQIALEFNFGFNFPPKQLHVYHCLKKEELYECKVLWYEKPFIFKGNVQISKIIYNGHYTYGVDIIRTNEITHKKHKFINRY